MVYRALCMISFSLRPLPSLPARLLLLEIVQSTSYFLPLFQHLGIQNTWLNKPRYTHRETETQGSSDLLVYC